MINTWVALGGNLRCLDKLTRDYNPEFLLPLIAGMIAVPGICILGWVLVERYMTGIMHIGWAIAGAVLLLFSAIAITGGTLSLLMKRMETRLSKRIHLGQNLGP